jgi:hypothetical protein
MSKLLAWHSDPAIKAKYVARYREHMRLDQIVQGTGYRDGKGCFVGCTLDKYKHDAFPDEIGAPVWFAHLVDVLFEGCSGKKRAAQFGLDLLKAIPEGVDLEGVKYAVAIGCHERAMVRLANNDQPYAVQCRKTIKSILDWLKKGAPEGQAKNLAERARAAAESTKSTKRVAAESARSAESAIWARSAAENEAQIADLLAAIRALKPAEVTQ